MEHYLREIARVLRPKGRCLLTIFLLNDSSLQAIKSGNSVFQLAFEIEGGRVADPVIPEAVVAHDESHFQQACQHAGLQAEIAYGSWNRRIQSPHTHDFVLALKQS